MTFIQHRCRLDMGESPPSIAVIRKVATLEGVDPTELPPLYDSIDPEALDSLLEKRADHSTDEAVSIEFTYGEYSIVVDSTGAIDVTGTNAEIDSAYRNVDGSIGDRGSL